MRVEVLNDYQQRFNGRIYYRNSKGYYQRMTFRMHFLHVDVWEYHNRKVRKGYDIHHIDQNKDNNQIENLQCLTRAEHRQLHAKLSLQG